MTFQRLLPRSQAELRAVFAQAVTILYVVGALVLSFLLLRDAGPELQLRSLHFPADGVVDWGGGKELAEGNDPYSAPSLRRIGMEPGYGLGHPPTTLLWFIPFAKMDAMTMKYAFSLMTLAMLCVHIALVLSELRLWLWGVTAVLTASVVLTMTWMHVHMSQVDLSEPIALLYVLSWWFLRRGRDGWAGVMAGLACSLKLYPGILVLYFALTQRWRAFAGAAIAYGLFAAEATRRLGPTVFKDFLDSTASHAHRWENNIRNASIAGITQRLFYPAYEFPHGHALSPAGQALGAVLSLLLLWLTWFVVWPAMRVGRRNPTAIDIPFAIITIVTMAPGPYQWEHYNVTLILPFFVLLAYGARARRPDGNRSWLTLVGVSTVLSAVTYLLYVDFWTRHDLPALAQKNPALRPKMYWYEVSAWLPWVVLLVALMVVCRRVFPRSARQVQGIRA